MAECALCGKNVSTQLYVRAKSMVPGVMEKKVKDVTGAEKTKTVATLVRTAPGKDDTFIGYYPPADRLRGYTYDQLQGMAKDCTGHSVDDIIAIIEKMGPDAEHPVRILWNPGSRIAPYLPSFPTKTQLIWEAMKQVIPDSTGNFSNHMRAVEASNVKQVGTAVRELVDEV